MGRDVKEIAAVLAGTQKPVSEFGEIPHLIMPEGYHLADIESLMPFPSRIKACFETSDPKSWGKYVERFKDPESTAIFVFENDLMEKVVHAVFDFHSKDKARWSDHIAIYKGDIKDLAAYITNIPTFYGKIYE